MARKDFSAFPYDTAFERAEAYLAKSRDKRTRPLRNNTRMLRVGEDSIAVELHSTNVVTMHRDGTFTIYGGGWNTVTTKERIRGYSPCNPGSDGNGMWVVGYTGDRTPPRVQKCRTCKGTPHWRSDVMCTPRWWDQSLFCDGGTTKYRVDVDVSAESGYFSLSQDEKNSLWRTHRDSAYDVPCEHGEMGKHQANPCEHGVIGQHKTGERDNECFRCDGTGRTDYGSNPIPVLMSASDRFRVDAEGKLVGVPMVLRYAEVA